MSNFLDKYKDTILLVIIGVLLILNILNSNTVKTDVKQYQKRFDYIDTEIEELKKRNQTINDRVQDNNEKIDVVTIKIESVDKTIKKVKKNTDEKISNVDNLKPNELELFFTNRYK